MESQTGPASPDKQASVPDQLDGSPFGGPGLLARAGPFGLVALCAEASLALSPGTHAWMAVAISLVLLAAVPVAFLLPWDRLPDWTTVLVPLIYTGSALALTLAAGTISGVGNVVLIPVIWTALFHRRWESFCVVAAIMAVEIIVSVVQAAPDAVIARRILLWGALGGLLAVAAHGLRDRIHRSQEAAARLQERIGELMVVQDRDRVAASLQGSVVQRIFGVGLKLQGALSFSMAAQARRRVESSVTDLDDTVRLLRQAIFGVEHRRDGLGLRQQVLQLCAGLSPVPEITFAGQVDDALLADTGQLLSMLRLTLEVVGRRAGHTAIYVRAGENLSFAVTGTGLQARPADGAAGDGDLLPLRHQAGQAGFPIEIEPVPGGTRLTWQVPLRT